MALGQRLTVRMSTVDTPPFASLVTSFGRHLRARNLSKKTVEIYLGAAGALAAWLAENTDRRSWDQVAKADLEDWLGDLLAERSAGHASNQYRAVQQLFKWLAAEEEIPGNPMATMSPPKVEEKLVPVLTDVQLKALFSTCRGKDFVSRRDLAILRMFAATGMRLAEMAGLRYVEDDPDRTDVDLDNRLARVTGKGRRERLVRFDAGTSVALDRYLRSRATARWVARPELWLAEKNRGVLTRTGIYQMVVRRGEQIGMDINPHMFRHTLGHRYLAKGGAEGDLMELAGWKSPQMLRRYGASAKAERARTAYDRVGVMENL
jgi:site-specific recombinase XerD